MRTVNDIESIQKKIRITQQTLAATRGSCCRAVDRAGSIGAKISCRVTTSSHVSHTRPIHQAAVSRTCS